MKILQSAFLAIVLPAILVACSPQLSEDENSNGRGRLGKADLVGSCEDSCDGPSASGNCWCDSQCAAYGDCCEDAATVCELDECTFDASGSVGCGEGEICAPGVCKAFCPAGTPGNCCAPSTCVPDPTPATCEDLGGSCKSSPTDVTFSADCLKDYGMTPSDGTCEAFNQTCCVPSDCPFPTPPPPGTDFCPDGAIPSTVVDESGGCILGYECPPVCPELTPPPPGFCPDGVFPDAVMDEEGECVIGFECPETNACEDNGGFCVNGFISECPADTTLLNESCGGSFEQTCCKPFFPLPPPQPAASCEGNCGDMVGDKLCYCDSECTGYGDCCVDYQEICVN